MAVVGDVMADATRIFAPLARERSRISRALSRHVRRRDDPPRGERRPAAARRIVEGLNRIPEPIVFPAHPRTAAAISPTEIELPARSTMIEPLGYLDFAALASQARVILTDSGGLQKEAYWYGVPCVTMRPVDGMGRHRRGRRERARRRRPRAHRGRRRPCQNAGRSPGPVRRRARLRADRGRAARYDARR